MITLFVIEESFIPEIIGVVGSVFDSVKPLLLLIFGLFMGFYIVEAIIEAVIIQRGGTPRSWIMKKYGGTAPDEEDY